MKWNCHIPGKANTDWDGGYFPLTMEFSEDYPAKPPKVGPFDMECHVGFWQVMHSLTSRPDECIPWQPMT